MALHCVGCHQQTESYLLSTLMTAGELISGDASHFVIVVMATVVDFVDP